jgi:GDP-mannose 4,6-dehydratase
MRVLVTGSTGFIGNQIAQALDKQGHDVYCLVRYVSGRGLYNEKQLKTVFADLTDHFAVHNTIHSIKPDAVFHLAALSPVALSYNRPTEVIDTNFTATVNLAECCMRENPAFKQFIFAGTSEEYGNQPCFPIKETVELYPNSPYAVSKVAADKYLNYMRDAYGFPITIVRPFNTYGRAHDAHFIVERIITQMMNGKEVRLGDSSPVRDFMFMDDHVDAYLTVFGRQSAVGETFNFCTGKGITIRELTEKLAELLDYKGKIVWDTIPKRPLDIQTLIGDNTKARSRLGWAPKVELEDGLKKTIEMLKK